MVTLDLILQVLVVIGGTLGIIFGIVLVLALVIQTSTEFLFGKIEGLLVSIFPGLATFLEKPKLREGIISFFTVGLGIWAAFLYQLDLVFLIAELFGAVTEAQNPFVMTVFGTVLTGIMMGIGASYLHDLLIKPLLNRGKLKSGDGVSHAG